MSLTPEDGEEKPASEIVRPQPLAGQPSPQPIANVTSPMAGPTGPLPPQAVQLMIGMGIQQQNPEVVKHMTDFLTRDSDNRLQWLKTSSGQTQKIRLAAIVFLAFLVILIFSFPLIELYRGDIAFVNKFMDEYNDPRAPGGKCANTARRT
jgi:hypothetical protein